MSLPDIERPYRPAPIISTTLSASKTTVKGVRKGTIFFAFAMTKNSSQHLKPMGCLGCVENGDVIKTIYLC